MTRGFSRLFGFFQVRFVFNKLPFVANFGVFSNSFIIFFIAASCPRTLRVTCIRQRPGEGRSPWRGLCCFSGESTLSPWEEKRSGMVLP